MKEAALRVETPHCEVVQPERWICAVFNNTRGCLQKLKKPHVSIAQTDGQPTAVLPEVNTIPQHIAVLASIMASRDTKFTSKFHTLNVQTLATEGYCRLFATKRVSILWSRSGMVALLNQLKTSRPLGNFETYLCTCGIEIRNK
jgi:hypothetical protein